MPVNPHVKGGSDVPVTDGGTGGSDASTGLSNLGGLDTAGHAVINHAGIPGVGDLTVAAHSTTDHAGIPGVPSVASTTARAVQSASSVALPFNTFTAITGASITLTVNGTYRIAFHARGETVITGAFVVYRLFNVTASAVMVDTEAVSASQNFGGTPTFEDTCSMETFITISASTTIRLEGNTLGIGTAGASLSDANGRTVITATRVGS